MTMVKHKPIREVAYSVARDHIRSGDLLSFKPCFIWYSPLSYFTLLVSLTNKDRIVHSAMACWWGEHLVCVQMQAAPDRMVLLSEYAKRWPGKIIVSRARVPLGFNRRKAAQTMVGITEKKYGWMRLLLLAFANTFTGGLLYPNVPNDDAMESKWPPVCSEAYSRAMRVNGFDPYPERPDCRTEPHHLFESKRLKPLFILV
jgi:hypothetical protein